jgi:SAM domain (Sterile alpha motif)/PH domain
MDMFKRMSIQQESPLDKRAVEQRQRTPIERPTSCATDFSDLDDDVSEVESMRRSLGSAGKSESTLSSFEEASTPANNGLGGFDFQLHKTIQGPRGPHLFRSSTSSSQDSAFHLTLSPITPTCPRPQGMESPTGESFDHISNNRPLSTLTTAVAQLNKAEVRSWTPRQVAMWMHEEGFEKAVISNFQSNDINGAILVDLKFEDLKELDIISFGKRHEVWGKIHELTDNRVLSPDVTIIEDCSDRDSGSGRDTSRTRKPRRIVLANEAISPMESVSIIGIEQLMPKPHNCRKGEDCPKFRKQQKTKRKLQQEWPISPGPGGFVFMGGNVGNPSTAPSVPLRPVSDALPSVVASSDVLGPGAYPPFQLEDLSNIPSRDPQENIKHFLQFQHVDEFEQEGPEPTPRYEMFPEIQEVPAAHRPSLDSLPKLSIPLRSQTAVPTSAVAGLQRSASASRTFSPYGNTLPSAGVHYRHGTPFSDMDVPHTVAIEDLDPRARDASQSVPPDMQYRRGPSPGPRSHSRMSSKPRLSSMTPLVENSVWHSSAPAPNPTPVTSFEMGQEAIQNPNDPNFAGWMKKRKTSWLRHEWHDNYCTLNGTRLALTKDEHTQASEKKGDVIDVDDYAVACSSINSNKVSAAFKAMSIARKKGEKVDETAFAFALIPAAEKKGAKVLPGGGMKQHHFAVKSRDERIDWMRELMLAKAIKKNKEDGFEVRCNGNMI